jgi:hypothetical protein
MTAYQPPNHYPFTLHPITTPTCRFVWLCDLLQIDFQLKPDVEVDLNERNKILQRAKGEADKVDKRIRRRDRLTACHSLES